MVQIEKNQCPSYREFHKYFKTHPTLICRSIVKASRSLQTKPAMLSRRTCIYLLNPFLTFDRYRYQQSWQIQSLKASGSTRRRTTGDISNIRRRPGRDGSPSRWPKAGSAHSPTAGWSLRRRWSDRLTQRSTTRSAGRKWSAISPVVGNRYVHMESI